MFEPSRWHAFFHLHEISLAFFHEINVILNYYIVCFFQDFERSSKCLLYGSIAMMLGKIGENVYKFCVEEKQPGLKMSLERAWDRTAALTGVSRVELPSPLIDQAPTVTKVTLDD